MTYYPDLSTCSYFESSDKLVAVGWLDERHPFDRGAVSAQFVDKLAALLRGAWELMVFCGPHFCPYCPPSNGLRFGGSRNLFIPGEHCVYVAPELIQHYISNHEYKPPEEFVRAVERCPEMNSKEYFSGLARFGIQGEAPPWA